MSRKQELLEKLQNAPHDRLAFDSFAAAFTQRGEYDTLYAHLEEVLAFIQDPDVLAGFRASVIELLRKHLSQAESASLAVALRLRLAGLLVDSPDTFAEALILVTDAFERSPSDDVTAKVVDLLEKAGATDLLIQLLSQKADRESGTERQNDTLLQLAYVALGASQVFVARRAFEALIEKNSSVSDKAKERLKAVDRKEQELQQLIKENLKLLSASTSDEERSKIKEELGYLYAKVGEYGEAIRMLEDVFSRTKSDRVFKELRVAYRETGEWHSLVGLLEGFAAGTQVPDERKELMKERARLYYDKIRDHDRGMDATLELYSRFPGMPDVVEFCSDLFAEFNNPKAQADLLARARQDTKDREQERHYLEWEAAIRWRRLGELDEAEKLYRRIKSIDPRNEPSLQFYEDYYRSQKDYRKLYTILSNRQGLVDDNEKVEVLRSMAEIALEHLASPDRAIDALKKIQALRPGDDSSFRLLASLLEESKRWHAVVELYGSRVDRLGDDRLSDRLEYLHRIRDIYSSSDKLPVPDMVVTTNRRILQLDPENAQAMTSLGEFYRKNGRWGDLVEILEKKAEAETDVVAAAAIHKEIAAVLIDQQHQEGAAITHLERVVACLPEDRDTLRLLLRAYRGRGSLDRLFEVGQRLAGLVTGKELRELLEELSVVALDRLNRVEDGGQLLEQLVSEVPDHPWALRRYRQALEKMERWSELADSLREGIAATDVPTEKRELKEKLAIVMADHLELHSEARTIFFELLEENPANRQAQKYLERILAQTGDLASLRTIYEKQRNLPGLLRFLEEFVATESRPERIAAAGMQMVALAEVDLKDPAKARDILTSLMERVPEDPVVARELLNRLPHAGSERLAARAWAVLADFGPETDRRNASARAAELLEKTGEAAKAYERTLALVMQGLSGGETTGVQTLLERAQKVGQLEPALAVLEEFRNSSAARNVTVALAIELAQAYRSYAKDTPSAVAVLESELDRTPERVELLDALEKIHTESGDWTSLESVLRKKTLVIDSKTGKKAEYLKLARLYEEILEDLDMATSVFRQLRDMDPADADAVAGLRRLLDETEQFEELVSLLEDGLQRMSGPALSRQYIDIADVYRSKLSMPELAIGFLEKALDSGAVDDALVRIREMFDADEALDEAIRLLESRYRKDRNYEALAQVLIRKSAITGSDLDRYSVLVECARLFRDRLGQPTAAFRFFERALRIDPSDAGILGELREAAIGAGEEVALFTFLSELLGLAGDNSISERLPKTRRLDVAETLAAMAVQLGETSAAIGALQAAIEEAPGDESLYFRLEQILDTEDRPEDLLMLLAAKRDNLADPDSRILVALQAAELLTSRLNRPEEAAEWLSRAMSAAPGNLEVVNRLAAVLEHLGRWSELAEVLETRRRHEDPDTARHTAHRLALIRRDQLADISSAALTLGELIESGPEIAEYRLDLAALLDMRDNPDYRDVAPEVVRLLEGVAEKASDWPTLARVLRVKAELAANSTLAAGILEELALLYRDKLVDAHSALSAMADAVRTNPTRDSAVRSLAELADILDDTVILPSAIQSGFQHLGDMPDCLALQLLASVLENSDRFAEAIPALRKLAEHRPGDSVIYARLDSVMERSGDISGRIEILTESLMYLDKDVRVISRLRLAELLFGQMRHDECAEQLLAALDEGDALTQDQRLEVFQMLQVSLEASERWFDLAEVLVRQVQYSDDVETRKGLLYRAAALHEERLTNPEKAIELYTAIVGLDPGERTAVDALARLLEETGQTSALEDLLVRQLDELSGDIERAELLLRLARLRLVDHNMPDLALDNIAEYVEHSGLTPDSAQLLKKAEDDYPDTAFRVSQILEGVFRREGDWERLAGVLRTQIERFPQEIDPVERYRELASIRQEHFSDSQGAFADLSEAFRIEPDSQSIYEEILKYVREFKCFDEFFDIYLDALVKLDAPDSRNNLRRKVAQFFDDELGDTEHAEFIYKDMLLDDIGNELAIDKLINIYQVQERFENLIEVLRAKADAQRTASLKAQVLYEMADTWKSRLDRPLEAADLYEEIVALDPGQWDAYRAMESLFMESGDIDSAIATMRRELATRTDSGEADQVRLRLSAALAGQQDSFDQAARELEVLLERDSGTGVFAAAVDLMFEVVMSWDMPQMAYVRRLENCLKALSDQERLADLYARMSSVTDIPSERVVWLDLLCEHQVNVLGNVDAGYAALKNRLAVDADSPDRRLRLVELAATLGSLQDAVDYLGELAAGDELTGSTLGHRLALEAAQVAETNGLSSETSIALYEQAAQSADAGISGQARTRLEELLPAAGRFESYLTLLEDLSLETSETSRRRELVLRAAEVAANQLDAIDRAISLIGPLAQEMPRDVEVVSLYESLLGRSESREGMEDLLRLRLSVLESPADQAAVRFRLASVLLAVQGRETDGIEELLMAVEGAPEFAPARAAMLAVLEEGMGPDEHRLECARLLRKLGAGLLDTHESRLVLEKFLELEQDEMSRLSAHLELAAALEQEGEMDLAFMQCANALRLAPGDESVEERCRHLAEAGGLKEDFKALLAEEADLVLDPLVKAAVLRRMGIYLSGDSDDGAAAAAVAWEQALELDESLTDVVNLLVDYYRATDQADRLVGVLERRLSLEADRSKRTAIALELARHYSGVPGEESRARQWWEELLLEPEARSEAVSALGAIYENAEEWDQLRDLLQDSWNASESADDRTITASRLAVLLEQRFDDYPGALHWYREWSERAPEEVVALEGMRRCAEQCSALEMLAEADERLLAVVSAGERSVVQLELARLYLERMERKHDGLLHLQALLQERPVDVEAQELAFRFLEDPDIGFDISLTLESVLEDTADLERLASLYELQMSRLDDPSARVPVAIKAADLWSEIMDEPGRAFEVLSALLSQVPASDALLERMAVLAERMGDIEPFLRRLEEAAEVATTPQESITLAIRIARIYDSSFNDIEASASWYRRVLQENPGHSEAISSLESLYQKSEMTEELAALYDELLFDLEGASRIPYLLKLAFLREAVDSRLGALDAYREVVELNPGNIAALNRIEGMLEDPDCGDAALELLEPIYRSTGDSERLARLLIHKARHAAAGSERSGLLAEAAGRLTAIPGKDNDAFDLYLEAIAELSFEPKEVLTPAERLAEKLSAWDELAAELERSVEGLMDTELKQEVLRRLALIYFDKLNVPDQGERKLRLILSNDADNRFALNMLLAVLERTGKSLERSQVEEHLGDLALEPEEKKEHYLRSAALALEESGYQQAADVMRKALNYSPADGELLSRMADIYRLLEAWEDLVDVLERQAGLQAGEEAWAALMEAALVASQNLESLERASTYCRMVLAQKPAHMEALQLLREILEAAGAPGRRELTDVLDRLAGLLQGDELKDVLWRAYELAEESGNERLAAEKLQRLVRENPDDVRALDAQITRHRKRKEPEALVDALIERSSRTVEPDAASDFLMEAAGVLIEDLMNMERASTIVDTVLQTSPNHLGALRRKAQLALQERDFQTAVNVYSRLAEHSADDITRRNALTAAARLSLKELDDAVQAETFARLAIAAGPADPDLVSLLSTVLERGGKYDELVGILHDQLSEVHDPAARAAVCKRLALLYRDRLGRQDLFLSWTEEAHKAQEDPELVDELLKHYRSEDDISRVVPLLQWKATYLQSRRQMKEVPSLLFELGSMQLRLGQVDEALAAFERCVQADGSFLPGVYNLALILADRDDRKADALSYLQTLLLRINELENTNQKVEVYLRLGILYIEKGEPKRAKTYLSRLLTIDKDHEIARGLLDELARL